MPEVEDEIRPVTSLFADIVGSTSLGEQLSPAEVKILVGECVSRMTEAVEMYGGVVRSFMGDGIAAFFGLEGAREDDPARACLSGIRIIEVVESYAADVEAAWGVAGLTVRVGVNAGKVGTGLVGAAQPQYVALGDPVNVAARLQSRASPTTVVVGQTVATRVADRFELEPVGALELRGRKQDVDAWRVVDYKGAPLPKAGGWFVGRDQELEHLDSALKELDLGRGQIVLLSGEAGIGKTRLATEARERTGDALWFSSRCAEDLAPRPYGPLIDVLRDWLDVDSGAPDVLVRVRLQVRTGDLFLSEEEQALPYLARLLGIEFDQASTARIQRHSSESLADAIRKAYVAWLRAIALRQPTVVWVDDVERCDESTAALLLDLAELTESAPLLMLLGLRPEPGTPGWRVRVTALDRYAHRTTEVRVASLDAMAASELTALLDSDGVIGESGRATLVSRASGNPLYLEEFVRSALERVVEGGVTPLMVDELELPPALEGLLLARIDRCPAATRRVLQVAAVCGHSFTRSLLQSVLDLSDCEEELRHLIRGGILREGGLVPEQQYVFRHALYQEAALGTLPPQRLATLHERVANALVEGKGGEVRLERIAGHYASSGNAPRAVTYLERAGERAASLASLPEARRILERALGVANAASDASLEDARQRLMKRVAELAAAVGDYEEAVAHWQALLQVSQSRDARAELLLQIARTEHDVRQRPGLEAAFREAQSLRPSGPVCAGWMLLMARVALRRDDLRSAERYLREARQLDGVLLESDQVEECSLWTALHMQRGDLSAARHWAERAMKATSDAAFEDGIRARRDLGIINLISGHLEAGESLLQTAYRDARDAGHSVLVQEVVANLSMAYLVLGALNAGIDIGRAALDLVALPAWRAALLLNLGTMELEAGDKESARVHLTDGVRVAADQEEGRVLGALTDLILASLDIDEGMFGRAAERAEAALGLSERLGGRLDVRLKARARLAEVALREGKHQDALEHARAAVELTDRCDRTESPLAWRMLGRAEMALGLPDARATLERALELAREMGMRLDEARALMALGLLDAEPDGEKFNQAREIFAECGAKRGLGELDDAICQLAS